MATIKAPNPDYSGISASVKFENGIGQTEDKKLIAWFEERGYQVEKEKPAPRKSTK